jgi:hypothetical protein
MDYIFKLTPIVDATHSALMFCRRVGDTSKKSVRLRKRSASSHQNSEFVPGYEFALVDGRGGSDCLEFMYGAPGFTGSTPLVGDVGPNVKSIKILILQI